MIKMYKCKNCGEARGYHRKITRRGKTYYLEAKWCEGFEYDNKIDEGKDRDL